jgi:hypothetical protein
MKFLFNYTLKITDVYKINYILTGFYFVQFLLIFIYSHPYSLPISTSYITNDQLLNNGYGNHLISAATSHLFDVNIKTVIIIILIFSFLVYAWLATLNRYNYEKQLRQHKNIFKWINGGVSYGLIFVSVGLLGGIYDITTLIILFIMPIILNYIFLNEEYSSDKRTYKQWPWLLLKFIITIIPIAIISWYLCSAIIYGTQAIGTYFYFIFATVVLLYLANIINQILQLNQKNKWQKYIYGEQIFIVLELVIKTAIIWQVFAGVLHP